MPITRRQAVKMLADHGFTPTQSAYTMDETQDGASFDAEIGKRAHYALMDVLGWLGYCCPGC